MSFQAMSWAVKQKVGNATGKAILLMLANYADQDGVCFPSQEKLAVECECARQTVSRFLNDFESRGLISRVQRRRQDGYRTSDEIKLSLDAVQLSAAKSDDKVSCKNVLRKNVLRKKFLRKNEADLMSQDVTAINSQRSTNISISSLRSEIDDDFSISQDDFANSGQEVASSEPNAPQEPEPQELKFVEVEVEVEDLGNPPDHGKSATSPPSHASQPNTGLPVIATSPPDEGQRTLSSSSAKPTSKAAQAKQFEAEFENIFWPAFPNKKAKLRARPAFVKARQKASLQAIMDGLRRYIETKPPQREWLHPTTFLNQERWADEPDPTMEKEHENRSKSGHFNREPTRGDKFTDALRRVGEKLDAAKSGQAVEGWLPSNL